MTLTILSIFVFQGLIFLGLIFLLRQFMKGNVKGELSHLEKLNDELLKKEAELKQKISQADQEYTSKMYKLEQDALTRQNQARQEATKLLEDSREQSLKEREKIIGEAIGTRDKVRSEIMAEMEAKAIEYSKEILTEYFTGTLRKKLQSMLMDHLIEGIESVNVDRYQLTADAVVLKVTEPLSKEDRDRIHRALKEKIHREVSFKEEIDAGQVAGVLLQFGSFVIDGTLMNLLKEAAARLKKEAHRRYQGVTQ